MELCLQLLLCVIIVSIPLVGISKLVCDHLTGEPKLQVQALDPYRVQEGTRVELPCFVVGTPQPEVTWFDVCPVVVCS